MLADEGYSFTSITPAAMPGWSGNSRRPGPSETYSVGACLSPRSSSPANLSKSFPGQRQLKAATAATGAGSGYRAWIAGCSFIRPILLPVPAPSSSGPILTASRLSSAPRCSGLGPCTGSMPISSAKSWTSQLIGTSRGSPQSEQSLRRRIERQSLATASKAARQSVQIGIRGSSKEAL